MDRKQILFIAIVTVITITAWVVFDILHSRSEVEISSELQDVIEPIDPNFNIEGLK